MILATTELDVNKKVCSFLNVKRASFASADLPKEETGMEMGGVTVFDVSNTPTYIDKRALDDSEILIGGGNRNTKILLTPQDLARLNKDFKHISCSNVDNY